MSRHKYTIIQHTYMCGSCSNTVSMITNCNINPLSENSLEESGIQTQFKCIYCFINQCYSANMFYLEHQKSVSFTATKCNTGSLPA